MQNKCSELPGKADHVLEVEGLFCPVPLARATERMVSVRDGQVLEVRATDPGVIIDIPAWCHGSGLEFLGYRRENERIVCYIRKPARGG